MQLPAEHSHKKVQVLQFSRVVRIWSRICDNFDNKFFVQLHTLLMTFHGKELCKHFQLPSVWINHSVWYVLARSKHKEDDVSVHDEKV